MLMVDTVQIHLPFFAQHCYSDDFVKTKYHLSLDLPAIDYNLRIHAKNVIKQDGEIIRIDYYHPYDSIPTSHTGIGFKLMDCTNNCLPHVILNASIAKIQQGHNVYGNTDMYSGVCEMLGIFRDAYPDLSTYLDLQNAYISNFDVTLPAQAPSRYTAERIRDYIRKVDWGRLRNQATTNKRIEYNTIYFGSADSKIGGFKVYCKGVEVDGVLADLERNAKRGNLKAVKDLQAYTQDVRAYADKSLRIEASIKTRFIREQGLSNNLWQWLEYQFNNPQIYQYLFNAKTKDFLQVMDGMRMPYDDDAKVYELLVKRLTQPTKSGGISTTKATNAYNFYKLLKSDGYYQVKERTSKPTFNRNIKILCDAGFNRAHLQNLGKDATNDTPVIRLLNLDFNAPLPASYIPPVSRYVNDYSQYLLSA